MRRLLLAFAIIAGVAAIGVASHGVVASAMPTTRTTVGKATDMRRLILALAILASVGVASAVVGLVDQAAERRIQELGEAGQ